MKNLDNILLIQLNEANFSLYEKYNSQLKKYKNLNKILNCKKLYTDDDDPYLYQEPWIKWMSFYLGIKSKIHKVFRLGHGQPNQHKSIFNELEDLGYNIGVLMSMNYKNDIKKNNFFVSDPWTTSSEKLPKRYRGFIDCLKRNILNNTENKISNKDKYIILSNLIMIFPLKDYLMLFISLFKSIKKPWIKALLLDCALVNLFVKLDKFENKKFNFIFLNSIAHIQHRYILNSKKINSKIKNPEWLISKKNDPIEESFYFLDYILGKLINNNQFIIMNGFSQIPYDRIKFYWRIKNLNSFFQIVGINFTSIDQKMTRDFEIHFDNIEDLNNAKLILDSAFCNSDNYRIFSDISIKNYSLFASLTYPFEIKKKDLISINNKTLEFSKFTSFVAIKNAMHSSKGTIYLSDAFLEKTNANICEKTYDISKIKDLILNILGKSNKVV